MDITTLREALSACRGDWGRIAELAGLNRKTIQRIVDEVDYNPTLGTINAITAALAGVRSLDPARAS